MSEQKVTRRDYLKYGLGVVGLAAGLAAGYGVGQSTGPTITTTTETRTVTETVLGTARATGYDWGNFEGKELHVQHWGGVEAKAIEAGTTIPWEQLTGARVVAEYGATALTMGKIRAQKDDPKIDVFFADDVAALAMGTEDLIVPLERDKIPNINQIYPRFITKNLWGAGFWNYQDTLIYNNNPSFAPEFKDHVPDTYELLWDPRFKGKLLLMPWEWGDGPAFVALVSKMLGGDEYSVDEKVWDKIRALKAQNPIFGENFTVIAELFNSGDFKLGYYCPQPFAYDIFIPGKECPMGIGKPKEGAVTVLGSVCKVKNSPALKSDNEAMVDSYINYALSKSAQLTMSSTIWYSLCNQTVTRDDFRAVGIPDWVPVGSAEFDSLITWDWDYIRLHWEEWIEKAQGIFAA